MAGGFAKTTGLEFDDLYQQARLAYWQASKDPRYDPRKASIGTFCSLCTYNQLCSYAAKQKAWAERLPTEPLDETMPEQRPSQEDTVYFRELMRALPDDAKTIIKMMFAESDDTGPSKMRERIREKLHRVWTKVRLEQAFHDIKIMLRTVPG